MGIPLRVLIVASEAVPFAKSGGLGDVVGALAVALKRRDVDVRIFLPRYRGIDSASLTPRSDPLQVSLDGPRWCAVQQTSHQEVPVYLLEHNALFDRPFLYGPPGSAYDDNHLRFALLCRGAIGLCQQLDWRPHVVHVHDWQGALLPVYLDTIAHHTPLAGTASLLTIHNLAHQGWVARERAGDLGLGGIPVEHLGLESHGAINVLRGGILHATMITTVSPSYAHEIRAPEGGHGLDSLLVQRRGDLFGVLNGIDLQSWDPEHDPHLPHHYSASNRAGKRGCKAQLQQEAGLPVRPELPLVGIVSRLVPQKGIDLLAAAIDRLLDLDLQLVLLGTGEPWAEDFFGEVGRRRPDRFRAWLRFDEPLAHRIQAGSDLLLMPSRWEPCGLTQLQAQRYGTLPIVRAVGGLKDTVQNFDEQSGVGTGFTFNDATPDAVVGVTAWAAGLLRQATPAVEAMIDRVMRLPLGWDRAAATYEYLYRRAVVRRRGG